MALVFVNAMSGEIGAFQEVDGNFGDRDDMNLWYDGDELVSLVVFKAQYFNGNVHTQIEKVAAVNNNTIVIIHSTGAVL